MPCWSWRTKSASAKSTSSSSVSEVSAVEGGGNGGPWAGGCCADGDREVAAGADGAAGPKSSRMSVRVSCCGSSLED